MIFHNATETVRDTPASVDIMDANLKWLGVFDDTEGLEGVTSGLTFRLWSWHEW